jgi:tripartite-type tricarboxylate transporter receptor subunit TctC
MQPNRAIRRRTLRALAGVIIVTPLLNAGPVLASETYPTKPIRLIVGYPPGGSNDIAARIIAPELSQLLGVSVVVENKAGANGVIGADHVAKAEPDGYTLLAPQTMKQPPFNTLKDLAAVNMMALTPEAIALGPKRQGINTLPELLDLAQKERITLSSSGSGGLPHLTIELLKKVRPNIEHVPYKGAGPALTDTLAGHVDGIVMDLPPLYSQIKEGKLKALAVTSEQRVSFLSQVPTAQESLPGFNVENWVGIFAPAKTPANVLTTLDQAVRKAVTQPKVKAALEAVALSPVTQDSPAAFQKQVADDYVRWGKILRDAGVEMN